jgi:16S rRNA (guanine966-N2)-methyltransferase
MRVIAGSARGIVLAAPRSRGTRPITDRLKETVFGILADRVIAARVLDLYAGSGAIGIEALSRGAASCCFVEHGREALLTLRRNVERARLEAGAEVIGGEVSSFLSSFSGEPFDLVFVDPPFAEPAILGPLERLVPHLAPSAIVVVRRFWRSGLPRVAGLVPRRERRLGETVVTFLEAEAGQ